MNNVISMYEEVFKDCVKCYLEDMEEENKVELTETEINRIVYQMIYKNDYLWEVVNEQINYYIGKVLEER